MTKNAVPNVVFLGGTAPTFPLGRGNARRHALIESLGTIFVIGFTPTRLPRFSRAGGTRFILASRTLSPSLQYALISMFVLVYLSLRRQHLVAVAQSPYEGILPAILKRLPFPLSRIRLAIELHGDFDERVELQSTRKRLLPSLFRILRPLAKFAIREADALRAVSSSTERALKEENSHTPLFRFAAWTDLTPFLMAAEIPKSKQLSIVFAGQVIHKKGVDTLVDAFLKLRGSYPTLVLKIIGSTPDSQFLLSLQKNIKAHAAGESVQFLPYLTQDELARQMRQARTVVLPSRSEGLGRVIIEAMTTGTPVVGSSVGGIPDLIQHGETGYLFPVGDEIALAATLEKLLASESHAEELGACAKKRAIVFFSESIFLEGYRAVISHALARPYAQATAT
jgi:glycosyltransferase involved in cell wall biosynthesis